MEFFTAVLGAEGRTVTAGYVHGPPEPMHAFEFANGAVLSVEFTEDALDDEQARRAAWLELRTDDPADLQQRVEERGLARIRHPYMPFFYVQICRSSTSRHPAGRCSGSPAPAITEPGRFPPGDERAETTCRCHRFIIAGVELRCCVLFATLGADERGWQAQRS